VTDRTDKTYQRVDLRGFARQSERELETTPNDFRPMMPLDAVPWVIASFDEVNRLALDAKAGRLLSLIDGKCNIRMIIHMSTLREDEGTAILSRMVELRIIELRGTV